MRPTRLPQKAAAQVGEKVPESVGDIAAGLKIEWHEDACMARYEAYFHGYYLTAGYFGYEIFSRGLIIVGDPYGQGYETNKAAATLSLAGHIWRMREEMNSNGKP